MTSDGPSGTFMLSLCERPRDGALWQNLAKMGASGVALDRDVARVRHQPCEVLIFRFFLLTLMRKKILFLVIALFGLVLMAAVALAVLRPRVVHQRPYDWDRFVLPMMEFKQEPISNVVKAVNDAVRSASKGSVAQAVVLDATPAPIKKVASSAEIEHRMDELISAYRKNEEDLLKQGADGYESAPYTGPMGGGHSLGCTFQMFVSEADLGYEERPDAIHLWRMPSALECRAYKVTAGLTARIEEEHKAKNYLVDAEPIVSVLANVTGIHTWSYTVPNGPTSSHSESRFDKVFKYLPDSNLILAIATPEEHAQAETRLKAAGLWGEIGSPSP
jgi:hypothetical protein